MSAWRSRNSSSGTGEKVESGTTTAPAIGAPSRAATASGRLPMSTPTRAPLPRPGGDERLGHPPGLGDRVGVRPAPGVAAAERVVEDQRLAPGERVQTSCVNPPRVSAPTPSASSSDGPASVVIPECSPRVRCTDRTLQRRDIPTGRTGRVWTPIASARPMAAVPAPGAPGPVLSRVLPRWSRARSRRCSIGCWPSTPNASCW